MAETRATYTAPALEKGLEILELLAAEPAPLGLRGIAEKLGRSKGEIFRVVSVLLARGYLVRDPADETLRLSSRLFDLGMRTPRVADLATRAGPALEALAERTGQSANLVVLYGGETVVIATASGGSELLFQLRLGYRRPAVDATSGLAIIAFHPARLRKRLVRESLAVTGVPAAPAGIARGMAAIRRQGYALRDSRDVVGITDAAAPVFGPGGRPLASIAVPIVNRLGRPPDRDAIVAALRRCCDGLSAELRR